ncbi:MAG: hypothetical protein ACI909_002481 [Planctomycetota bacterium]|jgi:uncharacterized protein YdcH (DUF465 family)
MFEYDNEIVESLLSENKDFERLYYKHVELKQKVEHANAGEEPLDDLLLEKLKKEKLLVKDRLAGLIENYRRVNI